MISYSLRAYSFDISACVRARSSSGTPLNFSATSDYSFTGLTAGHSYTVTVTSSGNNVTLLSLTNMFGDLEMNQTVDFQIDAKS